MPYPVRYLEIHFLPASLEKDAIGNGPLEKSWGFDSVLFLFLCYEGMLRNIYFSYKVRDSSYIQDKPIFIEQDLAFFLKMLLNKKKVFTIG